MALFIRVNPSGLVTAKKNLTHKPKNIKVASTSSQTQRTVLQIQKCRSSDCTRIQIQCLERQTPHLVSSTPSPSSETPPPQLQAILPHHLYLAFSSHTTLYIPHPSNQAQNQTHPLPACLACHAQIRPLSAPPIATRHQYSSAHSRGLSWGSGTLSGHGPGQWRRPAKARVLR
ncbi:hypothetical protein BU23DRAFT_313382 [Bimuria novae-zelandiae CBS 107.79]|uniref:Uncharacterized protein n=1 Tax=Bimuria novae-zelandiae CBS 107.79 TaxID=1447943 RepID=A0A6A5UNB4_9PLEO|nr:hypothetical protein BU23DRAFT_313382 [Bimuria novae-zelandiae CBS 107.79]